ncbi:hypothetical protein FB567DRAFT_71379 [Paraphoma chrysanthemicola]|uniref:Zn(2)-C6 fungal-type domain-containing protein n=1 Tax=Paraphoma chrysanthemicola TaxID=798071 RepID=A0A8K0R4K6_9PLEO|nr:hypothetical protein FB567DRAFT_71379 [Paraphoma chrysanthemicola]
MAGNPRSSPQYPYPTNKRARQACDNCRRKKSKCTGERPECSCCVRLRQKCVYIAHTRTRERSTEPRNGTGDVPQEAGTIDSNRLNAIETMLTQLAAAIDLQQPAGQAASSSLDDRSDASQIEGNSPGPAIQNSPISPSPYECIQAARLPDAIVSEGIALYFSNFCNQPCPILAYSQSLESRKEESYPPMMLYAMLALSLRSSRNSFFTSRSDRAECIARLTKLSWDLIARAYCDFDIDDAYFQALCLHAQVDAGDERLERAQAQVALGLRLAQTRGMLAADTLDDLEVPDRSRRQEIIWSLFMLDRMLLGGHMKNASTPAASFEIPIMQNGPFHPDFCPEPSEYVVSLSSIDSDMPLPPQNVACLQVQTIRIWEYVIDYVAQPPSSADVPLWRHDSPRAAILTKILDVETKSEIAGHTLSYVGPPARVLNEPRLERYFLVWLRFQLTLSVVNCILNHPFIIHIKTARLKNRTPITFLQKSYESSLIHANWVYRLLNHMDEAQLMLHDPFIGHLVAMAASIHLEHMKSQYSTVAASAKQKFEKCFDFVKRVSQEWPRVQATVCNFARATERADPLPVKSELC